VNTGKIWLHTTDTGSKRWRVSWRGQDKYLGQWAKDLGVDQQRLRRLLIRDGVNEQTMDPTTWDDQKFAGEPYKGANSSPYEQDLVCQTLVQCKGAMDLRDIGVVLGKTRQRVEQIEKDALEKLGRAVKRMKLSEGLLESLRASMSRPSLEDRMAPLILRDADQYRPKDIDWARVDWSKRNFELARIHRVDDSTVASARKRHDRNYRRIDAAAE
jgi:hypothetical protein